MRGRTNEARTGPLITEEHGAAWVVREAFHCASTLLMNSKTFQSSILSEMVRDVLTHTFIVKKHEPEVEATGWLGDWMKFIGKLRIPNVIDENPDLSYEEDEEEYIEKVSAYIESIVRKFALRCGLATRFESEVGK